jgi:hypothetical protein
LGGAVVLFSIVIYQFSIRETLEQKNAYQAAIIQAAELAGAPQQIQQLHHELKALDRSLGNTNADSMDLPQLILEKVSTYCKQQGTELKKFPGSTVSIEQQYLVETTKFVVEGDFIKLLKLVYGFEQRYGLGKVVAVEFNVEKELRSRADRLEATLYIQNIKKA